MCTPRLSTHPRRSRARISGILNLPFDYRVNNAYMLQQTCHGRPIVVGNTSRNVTATLVDRLETQNLQAQRRQLAAAKVRYLVISTEKQGDYSRISTERQGDYARTYPVRVSRLGLDDLARATELSFPSDQCGDLGPKRTYQVAPLWPNSSARAASPFIMLDD